jgi:glucose-6-phosphate isomerase
MKLGLDLSGIQNHLERVEIDAAIHASADSLRGALTGERDGAADGGWRSPARWLDSPLTAQIRELAAEIRVEAEVLVLVGVGGSNRGAQSGIAALGDGQVAVVYAGDQLSPRALERMLATLRGRSVYVNVIAKDFNTLEPGIAFRIIRQQMEEVYGAAARERLIVTGSEGEGQLLAFSRAYGCRFLPFPSDMGGRFSVLSAVGLLPMAVAGVDVRALIAGAADAAQALGVLPPAANPACEYAVARNLLARRGFVIENLVTLEPDLMPFGRWWAQLFAESEGKEGRGIFPTTSLFSEDLHALGQYIQQGPRLVMETFLDAHFPAPLRRIAPSAPADGFAYLDGKPYAELNAAVYAAALNAHQAGGVPCIQLHGGAVTASLLGELFYFFMVSVCCSAALLGVDPFGQPGVEAYKRAMYARLGKELH